eukprot:351583-Chlamydomonas_euryale.AAC.9
MGAVLGCMEGAKRLSLEGGPFMHSRHGPAAHDRFGAGACPKLPRACPRPRASRYFPQSVRICSFESATARGI